MKLIFKYQREIKPVFTVILPHSKYTGEKVNGCMAKKFTLKVHGFRFNPTE